MPGSINGSKFDIPIPHRNWQRALSESFSFISYASPGEIISLAGPPRAGKTLLIIRLIQMLFGESDYEQTGLLPAIVVEAVNTGSHGSFSTKGFTQRMLEAVKHPLFSMKGQSLDDMLAMQKMDRSTEATLRIALEQALIARGVKVLFIDETQHVKYVSKDVQAAFAVMDSWKCLAQTTGLVIVFVGAYPMLDVLSHSPHLLGRKHQVHFPRYHANNEDILAFGQLLDKYSEIITLEPSLNSLTDIAELMYEGSLGCIGLLKAWLKRADAIAMINNQGRIDENILRDTRLSDMDLNAITKEILAGEQCLSRSFGNEIKSKVSENLNKNTSITKSGKPFQKKPRRETAGNRIKGR